MTVTLQFVNAGNGSPFECLAVIPSWMRMYDLMSRCVYVSSFPGKLDIYAGQ